MSAQPTVLQVVILRDGLLVGTEVFVPGQYTLGSGAYSDLKLDDPSVGEAHATLYFQNGKAAVQDQGSVLGVFVNGHRVTACEVRPVDEVAIGPFSLKIRVLAQKPLTRQAPPPELAALFGGVAPAQAAPPRPPAPAAAKPPLPAALAPKVPATVVSTRNRNPAPASPLLETTVPVQKAMNLRGMSSAPFDVEDETMTESVMLGDALDPGPTTRAPQLNLRPPPPPPMSAPEPPRAAPVAPNAPRQAAQSRPSLPPVAPAGAALRKNQPAPAVTAPEVPVAVAKSRKRSLPSIPAAKDGKGAPRLFFELYWGELRQHARSFAAIPAKKPVIGGLDDRAPMPLWGFRLSQPQMVLADKKGGGYRVFVPPGAAVERRGDDGNFYPLTSDQLEAVGQRKFIGLANGQAVRFSGEGDISLVAYVQPPLPRPWSNPLKNLPFLALGLNALFFGLFGAFVSFAPSDEMPDFVNKNVPPVAVRLLAPEPKKKEEAKKKLEAIKKKEPEAKKKAVEVAKVEKPVAKPPPLAEPPKIKALEKLSAAGPAMKDLLAAVDKLGNGPGSKNAKNNYKMSDLIGKAPIANAGLGTFGIGGGGGGGIGTKGLEVLRGKGGGGIGALGAGNVGKGAVGGTVGRASVRSIGVQGTIDKEAVAKVINSHLSEVSACYERALLREPGLAGKIVLEWNISTSGTVTTAKTKSSTMKSSAVEACILTSLKTWKFPPAKGAGVVISYPFLFNSVGY